MKMLTLLGNKTDYALMKTLTTLVNEDNNFAVHPLL